VVCCQSFKSFFVANLQSRDQYRSGDIAKLKLLLKLLIIIIIMLCYRYVYYQSCYILTTVEKNVLKISYILDF